MKRSDDSAQMILIASFAIGMAIVVLTLVLNNIIFASNTASESNVETNVFEYSNSIQVTINAYEKAYSNAYTGSSINKTTFNNYIDTYTGKMTESLAFSGTVYTLENGNFKKPYFTCNGLSDGKANWTAIERINSTNKFIMAINSTTLTNNSNNFSVEAFDQAGTIWSAEFFRSGTNVNVTVTDGVTVLNSQDSSSGELNITSNLIDGSSFFDFHFDDETGGKTYSIRFINGNKASGTFLIAGDKVNGNAFETERIDLIEAKIMMNKNGKLRMDVMIPIILPKGQL